ncbi:MAG: 2-C-methyl-D-erythritol 4-phosphate cytidylyltransferase [Candidatus Omnitrophica bacterium]|nr:2-C-methyl-D-erythritol 4-phosphate cytidylyltransferase [Candidatus Omnitrophota bacterium]
MTRDTGVVIPAAGQGVRLGSRLAKAFVPLAGRPLILHALDVFQASPPIGWIAIAARREDRARLQRLVRAHRLTKVCAIVEGGASRAESVARGVAALPAQAGWIVIHDAARPLLSRQLLERVLRQARRDGAVACGLPASVTVKSVDRHHAVRLTLDREGLWLVQTPQVIRRDWLSQALARADGSLAQMPDDAALLEWAGFPVRLVAGDPRNIKVTTREDLVIAEALLKSDSHFFGKK